MTKLKTETLRQRQARLKPSVEDAIRQTLNGEMRENALDFVAYVGERNISFRWAGIQNTWHASFKGKRIGFIRVNTEGNEKHAWKVGVSLFNFRNYEIEIIQEGLHGKLDENLSRCSCFPNKCGHAKNDVVFGKEFVRCWKCLNFGCAEPDKELINQLKYIFDKEYNARIK